MISQSILLELAVGDTVQLYMYTSSGITDHKNSRYTHLVGLLLRQVIFSLLAQPPFYSTNLVGRASTASTISS